MPAVRNWATHRTISTLTLSWQLGQAGLSAHDKIKAPIISTYTENGKYERALGMTKDKIDDLKNDDIVCKKSHFSLEFSKFMVL